MMKDLTLVRPPAVFFVAGLALIALIITGCSSTHKLPVKPLEHMEVGWTPRSVFQSPSYAAWFDTTYAAYKPDSAVLEKLAGMKDSVDLIVVYGTWCSDSRRELPRFWKIEESIHFPPGRITMIAVDRTMEIPPGIKSTYGITNVPTIMIRYRGFEMGRIVEQPHVTLEQDLLNTLAPVYGQ
jgi:thiol-disulfide isomerase/thioredoxin